jgi:hypothetical protein
MAGLQEKDDALVTQIRSNIRVEGRIFWSLLIAFLIISALFLGMLEFHMPMETTGAVAFGVLLVWIVLVFRVQTGVQPVAGPIDEETLRKTIDDQHRRWRWYFSFVFIVVGGLAAVLTFSAAITLGVSHPFASHSLSKSDPLVAFFADHPLARSAPLVSTALDFAFLVVFAVFQVCLGPGFLKRARRRALNDEHTRALQHSAAMFGYPLCAILMCAVLCAMTLRPQWGLLTMPGAIAAAVILPGIYFLLLQWRAGRDG